MVVLDVGVQGCVKQLETVDGEQGVELVGDVALVVVVEGQGHGEVGQVVLVSVATSVHYQQQQQQQKCDIGHQPANPLTRVQDFQQQFDRPYAHYFYFPPEVQTSV